MATLLIIEDEAPIRNLIYELMVDREHTVVTARNGLEGVKQFHAVKPDLVITDLFMPAQDGLETIRQIRTHSPEVKILAITGKQRMIQGDLLTIAQIGGACRTLHKPFSNQEMIDTVNALLLT